MKKEKNIFLKTTEVTKQNKKEWVHRTDQRYHPTRKGLGLGLVFQDGEWMLTTVPGPRWITLIMASKSQWKEDDQLEQDLKTYTSQNLKRSEVLDFMQRDFPQYNWSLATLDRPSSSFGIHYIYYDIPLAVVSDAVQKELEGPGQLLGYTAMNQKLRTEHNVQVPRHLVYNMIAELNPEGLEARSLQRRKKKPKGQFTSEGPLWVASLDGHDKRLYWHVFSQNPLLVCVPLELKSFGCKQDVSSVPTRNRDASEKPQGWQRDGNW